MKLFYTLLIVLSIGTFLYSWNLQAEAKKAAEIESLYQPPFFEPFLGQIIMFGGNFAPRGWALCDGQLLPINQYQALFSILGTTYGGDGRTTFALPDLRGRAPIHAGQGPGLSSYRLGQRGGQEFVTLNTNEIPSHNHQTQVRVNAGSSLGLTNVATDNILATQTRGQQFPTVYSDRAVETQLRSDATEVQVLNNGGSQAHENRMPYQAINYIIALQGTFPSRN